MPRKPLIRSDRFPYHITVRSNNREWFYLPIEETWKIFDHYLDKISKTYHFQIHVFLLMNNHFHMVVTTPRENLDSGMRYLLRETCREVNKRTERINHLFGGPYKWSLIGDMHHYQHVVKYVYRNPVKAGMCLMVEQHPFSTLHPNRYNFSVIPSVFDSNNSVLHGSLDWLNLSYTLEEDDCLRRGLRRKEFVLSPHRRARELPELFRVAAK